MYIYHIFFIHSSDNKHLAGFHVLVIVNNTSVTEEYKYIFDIVISFPLEIYLQVGLLDHRVVLFLFFAESPYFFSYGCISLYSHQQCTRIPVSPCLQQHWSVQFQHTVQFSSVVSDCLSPHGLQHARSPCPSPTPGVYTNSCPLSQWCHTTISSSVVPFSSCPQSFPATVFSNESVLCIRWPKY